MPNDMPDEQTENENENKVSGGLLEEISHEELMKKLNEAEQKAQENWERVLRMQADNENLLRRTERDVASAHKYALEKFTSELLPIVDSLELCLANVQADSHTTKAIIEGIELTLKMFNNVLEKFGVKQVNPVGKPFDPEFEQAISMQYDPKVKPGNVVSVLQKGYTLNNRLLRPALVIVAKAKDEAEGKK